MGIKILGLMYLMWGWWLMIPSNKLKVIFCDVGQGDAALISKGYFQMLIDTGGPKGNVNRCLDKSMPLGDKKIEVVIITHQDDDHVGGLDGLKKFYQIDHLYEQKSYADKLYSGDLISYGGIVFEVLYPEVGLAQRDNDSVVGLLRYKDMSFLFSGDIDKVVEKSILDKLSGERGIEVLKVSHHGSKAANGEEWLGWLAPKWSVISVGKNNYGHPSGEVLGAIAGMGSVVKRTDKEGDIVYIEK